MTTETTTPAERAKQISDRLLEIAPYPETGEAVTAQGLAKYLAVRAAVIRCQQLGSVAPWSRQQIDLMTVLFAAGHALFAGHDRDRGHADLVAREVWSAWESGDGIGDLLWHHLGAEVWREVAPLADELAALREPYDGLLAHADVIRSALNRAILDTGSRNHREAFTRALVALDAEADRVEAAEAAASPEDAGSTE